MPSEYAVGNALGTATGGLEAGEISVGASEVLDDGDDDASDGDALGAGTGATDGLDDDASDGDALGEGTGPTDGLDDGDALGAGTGATDGLDDGCASDGDALGAVVGTTKVDGTPDVEGDDVGAKLG